MDEPHPVTGLTKREAQFLRETWAIPKKDPEGTGVEILIRFLTKHPENQKYFKAFQSVPLAELRGHSRFRKHALNVVTAIDNAVENLDNVDVVVEALGEIGASHVKRKISEDRFNELKAIILPLLSEACSLDAAGEATWKKLFDVAYGIIFMAMKQSV